MRFLIYRTTHYALKETDLVGVKNIEFVTPPPGLEETMVEHEFATGDVDTIEDLMALIDKTNHLVVSQVGYYDWVSKTLPTIEIYDDYRE